jgi:hypothetical protein
VFLKIGLFFVKAKKLSSQPAYKPKNITGMPILKKNPKKAGRGRLYANFWKK